MKKKNVLLSQAIEVHKKIMKSKQLYARLENLTEMLMESGFKKGDGVELVDNFKKKNKVFRATSFRRYELKFKE